jgi:hypothetical protein
MTFPGFWAVLGVVLFSRIDIANVLQLSQESRAQLLTVSLLMYIIVPMLFVYFMVYKKRFESIQLATVRERKIAVPFALFSAILMMVFTRQLLTSRGNLIVYNKLLNFHPILEWEQLVILSLIVQTAFVFLNFKISIHMLSVASFTTFLLFEFQKIKQSMMSDCLVGECLYQWPKALLVPQNMNAIIIGLILLSAIIFISRKILKVHTYQELIIGSIVGISITFVNSILLYSLWN